MEIGLRLALGVCLAFVCLVSPARGSYSIERIAGPGSYATGMNSQGEVVGQIGDHAFRWTQAGGMVDLGPGSAVGVNDNGTVAINKTVGTKLKVVLVSSNGQKRYPPLTQATAISDTEVVGYNKYGSVAYFFGSRYSRYPQQLGPINSNGGQSVLPSALSEHGYKLAGTFCFPSLCGHAFFWNTDPNFPKQMIDVGAFLPLGWNQQATGVNDSGEVVGFAGPPDYTSHPEPITHVFTYTRKQSLVVLRLPCRFHAAATAINNRGRIVGDCTTYNQYESGTPHPFIYSPGSGLVYLPTNGMAAGAVAVNNRGQVAGSMDTRRGTRAVLWQP